jgi:ribokinase
MASACEKLRKQGVPIVIATLGSRGLIVVTSEGMTALAGLKAKVVDTTGAGDRFVGAWRRGWRRGRYVDAARYANAAAACSVERLGAAPSMPTPKEVAARLARA